MHARLAVSWVQNDFTFEKLEDSISDLKSMSQFYFQLKDMGERHSLLGVVFG